MSQNWGVMSAKQQSPSADDAKDSAPAPCGAVDREQELAVTEIQMYELVSRDGQEAKHAEYGEELKDMYGPESARLPLLPDKFQEGAADCKLAKAFKTEFQTFRTLSQVVRQLSGVRTSAWAWCVTIISTTAIAVAPILALDPRAEMISRLCQDVQTHSTEATPDLERICARICIQSSECCNCPSDLSCCCPCSPPAGLGDGIGFDSFQESFA